MHNLRTSLFYKAIAILLCFVFLMPASVHAAEARASYYLNSYTSYICHMGDGDLEIWYRVTGTGPNWADIGVLNIQLFESTDQVNWTRVTTFQHYNYETMLGHDTWQHMSHVDYEGTEGKYYKAYVCIWAGDANNNGDSRYIWTEVEYASPTNP